MEWHTIQKQLRQSQETVVVSQADFQEATNLSRMQVVTILNHLKDDGKLEHTGSKRAGQWVLKEEK